MESFFSSIKTSEQRQRRTEVETRRRLTCSTTLSVSIMRGGDTRRSLDRTSPVFPIDIARAAAKHRAAHCMPRFVELAHRWIVFAASGHRVSARPSKIHGWRLRFVNHRLLGLGWWPDRSASGMLDFRSWNYQLHEDAAANGGGPEWCEHSASRSKARQRPSITGSEARLSRPERPRHWFANERLTGIDPRWLRKPGGGGTAEIPRLRVIGFTWFVFGTTQSPSP